MTRIVIFGNSGSGKSTLARRLAAARQVAHMDLDDIAWKGDGIREDLEVSLAQLRSFLQMHPEWVIEGCYSSLIQEAATRAHEMLFINPGVEACQANCRSRPWEPHKYQTKQEQDANLSMLLNWVAAYQDRGDEFSLSAHRALFEAFPGTKRELRSNEETTRCGSEGMARSGES